MALVINLVVAASAATLFFSSGLRAEVSGSSAELPEELEDLVELAGDAVVRSQYDDGAAATVRWSAPAGTSDDVKSLAVEMGLRGSLGVRQAEDELLYSTAVRTPGERGQDQGYVLGYRTNATIDHYRWVYVGTDGHTATMQVLNGGLGFHYIALYLKSQDDHGIYYNISIYGR